MEHYKHTFVFILLLALGVLLTKFNQIHYLAIGILILFAFNLLVRKSFSFKNYFMSPFNFFAGKFHYENEMDISKELLFPKVIEGLENSGLKIQYTNESDGEILAISSMTFISWGENVYVTITEQEGKSKINLCSVAFFQMYTWGKNKANQQKFVSELEKSFII